MIIAHGERIESLRQTRFDFYVAFRTDNDPESVFDHDTHALLVAPFLSFITEIPNHKAGWRWILW